MDVPKVGSATRVIGVKTVRGVFKKTSEDMAASHVVANNGSVRRPIAAKNGMGSLTRQVGSRPKAGTF